MNQQCERVQSYSNEHKLRSKRFDLARPVSIGEVELEQITAREPLAGDFRHMPDGEASKEIVWLVERCCMVGSGELELMSYADFAAIEEWVLDFLE